MATTAAPHAPASHGPPKYAAAMPPDARISPDAMRGPRSDQSVRSRGAAWSDGVRLRSPETPLAALVLADRLFERGAVEVRPQHVEEDQLGVGRLPQHEIGEPRFTRRAD